MQEHERLTPELQALEAQLATLVPTAAALDRDRLMYEAGRAAATPRGRRAWPAATLLAAALALIVGRWTAPPASVAPAPVVVQVPAAASAIDVAGAAAGEPDSYLQLRRRLERDDLLAAVRDGQAPPTPVPKASQAELRREFLN